MSGLSEQLYSLLHTTNYWLVGVFISGIVFGWLICRIAQVKKIATLEAMLEYEMQSAEEKIDAMGSSFAQISNVALHENNKHFIQLAEQMMGRLTHATEMKINDRTQTLENLVTPLRESLQRSEQQLQAFDKDRRDDHISLTEKIANITQQHQQLDQETRRLVQALRRPEIRGQWGEISLRRLVEISGMNAHCDFSEQLTSNGGHHRPDMIIHLPGKREVVVDVKTPLDAYLSAHSSDDPVQQSQFLRAHSLQLKKKISDLASKKYWSQFDQTPEFVVLFIPGDQFLNAALEKQPELIEYAITQKVVLATPSSFIALLRTIEFGWSQENLNQHAEQIRRSAQEYHQRLATFSEHLTQLGEKIHGVVGSYNSAIGSYRHKLIPIARQFSELGLKKQKEAQEPEKLKSNINDLD